eukprot:TRINITY_DN48166_c0_g1_i1.p1 TRINITY_DN48166_c0_g1~~TRINITY_DN48166_c0_g1_i1.p1  ORF type:complete len:260 (+),score=29.22 TRINITY_DN48166_c0_g1_i1:58-837(+)
MTRQPWILCRLTLALTGCCILQPSFSWPGFSTALRETGFVRLAGLPRGADHYTGTLDRARARQFRDRGTRCGRTAYYRPSVGKDKRSGSQPEPSRGSDEQSTRQFRPSSSNPQQSPNKPWWEDAASANQNLAKKLAVERVTDPVERLRMQMSLEEQAFDREIEDVIIAGKRALLKLRMQKAVQMVGLKTHLFKKIKRQIARALTLRREREIARGITREQSCRMKRRRKLEVKIQYEEAYGSYHKLPKSNRWLRRMGKIV